MFLYPHPHGKADHNTGEKWAYIIPKVWQSWSWRHRLGRAGEIITWEACPNGPVGPTQLSTLTHIMGLKFAHSSSCPIMQWDLSCRKRTAESPRLSIITWYQRCFNEGPTQWWWCTGNQWSWIRPTTPTIDILPVGLTGKKGVNCITHHSSNATRLNEWKDGEASFFLMGGDYFVLFLNNVGESYCKGEGQIWKD